MKMLWSIRRATLVMLRDSRCLEDVDGDVRAIWRRGEDEDEASMRGVVRVGNRLAAAGGEAVASSEGAEISRCPGCFGLGRRVRRTRCICVRLWVYFFECR